MNELKKLNLQEKEMLLKAPAYVSLLAANADAGMDETEKRVAIEFSHIKTFSCHPMLREFYHEVEKTFNTNIEQLNNQLPKDKVERKNAINVELAKLESIFIKLGNEYAATLHRSFISFSEHVSKAHKSVLESFIIPLYIKGLTD
ncbi:MAG TPA: hypothetical protein PK210_12395 [Bacteroidia bacterium]|nr:hypothetical protein [Bacteroidia bacterium]